MDNITILDDHDLTAFLRTVGVPEGTWTGVHTLRIHQREDGFAFKVNSGTWSPTIGRRADAGGY